MATQKVLASAVVEFVAKGASVMTGTIGAILKSITNFGAKANSVLNGVSKSFTGLAIGASAIFTGFSAGAMEGTAEGERFSHAMEYLTRVIGDMFAPAIRMATDAAMMLAKFIQGIDPVLMMVAGTVIATVAGFASFIAIWPVLAAVMAPVLAVLGALMSPIGLIVAGIAALAVGIAWVSGVFDDWEGTATKVMTGLIAGWDLLSAGWNALMEMISSAWEANGAATMTAITDAWNVVYETLSGILSYLTDAILNFFGSANEGGTTLGSIMATVYEVFADIGSVIEMIAGVIYDLVVPAFKAIGAAAMWLYDNAIKPVVNAIVEAWGGSVGQMTFTWKGFVQFIGDLFLGVVLTIAELINSIAKGFGIAISAVVKTLAWLGEKTKVISKATADSMREFADGAANFQAIDTGALTGRLGAASNQLNQGLQQNAKTAKELAATIDQGVAGALADAAPKAAKMLEKVKGIGKNIKKEIQGGGGFKASMAVSFEAVSGTFERLQQALVSPKENMEKATLGAIQEGNNIAQQQLTAISKISMVGA